MRKIIGKKNKVHYVEETTRFQMVKSHKGWLVICASTFALGSGMLVTSRPVSAEVATTSTSSSAVNAETTSASSSSVVNAETTSASSSSAVNADLTLVTKDNFLDYFLLNGSATYDQNTGIVTITPDENNKVGNFSLKSKIDMNSSFTLTGQVNIGNKTSSQGGADGVGFAFHDGNTTDIGNAGGNLGIGGLINAVGFKLDTWHNNFRTPKSALPGAQVSPNDSNGYGWSADPSDSEYPQFGGFVTTSNQEIQAIDNNSYQRWWAETDTSSVQKLKDNNLDNNFHDFVASYDSATRVLTISYTETDGNTLTWTKTIDSSSQAMAMIVSASTGGAKNLQQFKITSFDFNQAATVNVKYVDTKGNQIAQGEVTYPNGANVNGTYTTGQLEIPNYKFVRMDDGTATGATSLPATGTLTKAGDNGTVIYVYAPAYAQTSKTISETIKYIDQDGKEVAKGYTADPITFVTVTNPVDNTTTTYYSTTAKTATLDDNGVPTEAGWTKADSTDFAEVVNPKVDGYKVISNDAPNSDLTSVAVQTVYTNSSDLDITVVYAKNAPTTTSTTTVEPTTTVSATTTTVEPTTTASTSTTTVEPTTTVSTSTTTVEPTTTVAATTTTVEPTTTAAATTTTVEPTTTVAATTTTVEPTTTVAATTTTVEPTTTAAATTTVASTTTVAPTTSVTTTAATTVDVPGTTTGVTPPPAGGKKGRTLPKTGEESGLVTTLVGFALLAATGLAGFFYRKSKKA